MEAEFDLEAWRERFRQTKTGEEILAMLRELPTPPPSHSWSTDGNGLPRVFYHGTADDVTAFDLNHLKQKQPLTLHVRGCFSLSIRRRPYVQPFRIVGQIPSAQRQQSNKDG